MTKTYKNLVGGEWIEAGTGTWLERHNPADTSELVARYPGMDVDDVDHAFAAASQGFSTWRRTKILDRGRILLDAAKLVRERAEAWAHDITAEMGKTLAEARAEVSAAANFLEFYGGLARSSNGEVLADRREGVSAWTQREPLGVVVLITPWNDPLVTPARKLAPALLSGNAVVLKPASETPVSAYNLVAALLDAGLPAGVVNTASGPSSRIGQALIDNPAVRAVSFTGSTAVGLDLHRQLAGRTVRLQTEMGGKNAAIVCDDADIVLALEDIVGAGCGQGGQRCTATSRVLVADSIHQAFIDALMDRVADLRVGPGLDEGSDVGPLVSEAHLDSVLAAVASAEKEGATIAVGGERVRTDGLERGHFMAPTVVTEVEPTMSVWREEIFGPVLTVTPFSTVDEAIAQANDSRYGLSASVFTRDIGAAYQAAGELDTGQVAINLPSTGWDVHTPFGGFKESGSPFKEHGTEGVRFYTRVKTVALRYA